MWKQRERLYNTNARTAWQREYFNSVLYPPNMTVDWLDTDKPECAHYQKEIKYTFNEYGFRSDSFFDVGKFNILTCGCSMTVGVGVDQHETWTNILREKIKKYTNKEHVSAWNIATSGASPDYVARSIWQVESLLKPQLIFVFWPPITRLEVPHDAVTTKITQSSVGSFDFPKELVNEEFLLYNFHKNLHFLENLFLNHSTTFYANPVVETMIQHQLKDNNPFVIDRKGRDGVHPGTDWHYNLAEYYFQQAKPQIDLLLKRESFDNDSNEKIANGYILEKPKWIKPDK